MVLMTMVGRASDGLPLAASMQADEQSGREFQDYQAQAKQILRKLSDRSPARCNIESGDMMFHYIIENGVCYLTLTEKMFPSRLAFGFLEDISREFWKEHSSEIPTVVRPYSFIEFDNYIQKSRRNFMDSRSRRNMNRLNDELHDVQKFMVQNIDEILQRGETLSVLDDKAGNLRYQSEKYKKDAKYLNLRTAYAKYAAVAIVLIIFLIYVRYWLF